MYTCKLHISLLPSLSSESAQIKLREEQDCGREPSRGWGAAGGSGCRTRAGLSCSAQGYEMGCSLRGSGTEPCPGKGKWLETTGCWGQTAPRGAQPSWLPAGRGVQLADNSTARRGVGFASIHCCISSRWWHRPC